MPALIAMQPEEKMDFPAAMGAVSVTNGITHVLDFGPGGNDAVGGSANFAAQVRYCYLLLAALQRSTWH